MNPKLPLPRHPPALHNKRWNTSFQRDVWRQRGGEIAMCGTVLSGPGNPRELGLSILRVAFEAPTGHGAHILDVSGA